MQEPTLFSTHCTCPFSSTNPPVHSPVAYSYPPPHPPPVGLHPAAPQLHQQHPQGCRSITDQRRGGQVRVTWRGLDIDQDELDTCSPLGCLGDKGEGESR